MSDANKRVVREFFEGMFTDGDLDVVHEYLAADYVDHSPFASEAPGPEGFRQRMEMLRSGLAVRMTLDDLVAEGESYANFPDRDPVISAELAVGMGVVYMGEGRVPAETPLASPLYADLHDLPPLFVVVGEDLLHIYPLFASILPEGREAIEQIGRFVQERTPARVG